jgi:hypothetical protein
METKTCIKCDIEKPISEFSKHEAAKDGFRNSCKDCTRLWHKEHRNKPAIRDRERLRHQDDYEKNRDYRIARSRVWALANPERVKRSSRSSSLSRKYGMTIEDYDTMLNEQGHKCKICGQDYDPKKPLCVDHCHNTNEVRGLLCNNCNTLLGMAQDSIDVLFNAIAYLEKEKIWPQF